MKLKQVSFTQNKYLFALHVIDRMIDEVNGDHEGLDTILLSLHSFTPVMDGFARPWDVGVLHWRGRTDFAHAMLATLRDDGVLAVGDNVPYAMDATDFTVPFHAFARDLSYAEIEVRQDLIGDSQGQSIRADHLRRAAEAALQRIGE